MSSDNEDMNESVLDEAYLYNDEKPTSYRFMNSKDGMGKETTVMNTK